MSHETEWFESQKNEEAKEERATLRDIVSWVIGGLCFVALLIAATWPTKAGATEVPVYVADHDGVRLRLLSAECSDPASLVLIATAPPQFQGGWKASSSDWRMRDGSWQQFAGCWILLKAETVGAPDDVFVLVFSDGSNVQILKRDLLKKSGDKPA